MSLSKQMIQCDLCSHQLKVRQLARYNVKSNLYLHFIRRHAHMTDAEKLICDQCAWAVFGKGNLWRHILHNHLGQLNSEMKECEECERRCTTVSDLYRHFRVCHTAELKPFGCADCGYLAHNKKNLCTHAVLQHLGIQPQCNFCPKKFSSERALRSHRLVKHNGVKYECDVCAKSLSIKRILSNHMQSHML